MRWFLGVLVAWLAFDTFIVMPREVAASGPKTVRAALSDDRWPELPARKESTKPRRVQTSLSGVQVHSGR